MQLEFKKGGSLLIVLVALSCVATMIAMSTNYWVLHEVRISKGMMKRMSIGLWKMCDLEGDNIFCNDYTVTTGNCYD